MKPKEQLLLEEIEAILKAQSDTGYVEEVVYLPGPSLLLRTTLGTFSLKVVEVVAR